MPLGCKLPGPALARSLIISNSSLAPHVILCFWTHAESQGCCFKSKKLVWVGCANTLFIFISFHFVFCFIFALDTFSLENGLEMIQLQFFCGFFFGTVFNDVSRYQRCTESFYCSY